MSGPDMSPIIACAKLVESAGAKSFEVSWECEHGDDVEQDHNCPGIMWRCSAVYNEATLQSEPMVNPVFAAHWLALQILEGGRCRCGKQSKVNGDGPGCQWELVGDTWEPGCDAPPIKGIGERGNLFRMNREMRRAAAKQNRRN